MNIKKVTAILAPVFLLVFVFLAGTSLLQKSPTYDEPVHLTGGYSVWKHNDYRVDPTGGILTGSIAALPLLFNDSIKGIGPDSIWWKPCDNVKLTEDFLSRNNIDRLFLWPRLMMVLVGVFGGVIVFFASRQIWGRKGALISLAVYALSPTILAHTRFIAADLISSIFFFISAWSFWHLLNKFTWQRLLITALSLSCLALAKLSGVLILPVLISIAICHLILQKKWRINVLGFHKTLENRWQRTGLIAISFILIGVVVIFCIWGAYGFRYSMLADANGREVIARVWPTFMKKDNLPLHFVGFCKEYKLLPEGYLFGIASIIKKAFEGSYSFLNGQCYTGGTIFFFPFAFIYKTPIAIILLFLIGLVSPFLIFKKTKAKQSLYLWYFSFPLALILVYGYFAVTGKLNIGHRHLIPIYLPIFVLAGGAGMLIKKDWLSGKIIIGLLLAGLLIDNLLVYPHYLSYFSPVAGGSTRGYKHLVDSSLDWGQDIKAVQHWLEKERAGRNSYISYFGCLNLDDYQVPQQRLICWENQKKNTLGPLKGGTYCISATMLQMVYRPKYFHWNQKFQEQLEQLEDPVQRFYQATQNKQQLQKLFKEKNQTYWLQVWHQYELLRFAKLVNSLRKRPPNHMIGYSYLVYELTDEDMRQILNEGEKRLPVVESKRNQYLLRCGQWK